VAPRTVLILDDDLGFCMWLGRVLNDAGIRALPACRSEEALEIGADPQYRIGLVIVNPLVEGCSEVLDQNPDAKVISIGEPGNLAVDSTVQPEGYVSAVREILNARV
jgi:DNA-binding response OmpR family regulator